MDRIKTIHEYTEEVGGVFSCDDLEAVPFNHWKKDCEWLVLVLDLTAHTNTFIPVRARTAKKACVLAFHKYNDYLEEDDDI